MIFLFLDCQDLFDAGYTTDGNYTIYPFNDFPVEVKIEWLSVVKRYFFIKKIVWEC